MENITRIGIAQINTTPFDIEKNTKKALEYIEKAKKQKIQTLIFSKAFLCGGHYRDVIKKFPFIMQNEQTALEYIASKAENIEIIIGIIKDRKDAVAIIKEGKIQKIITNSDEISIIAGKKACFIFQKIKDTTLPQDAELIIDLKPSISKTNSEYFRNTALSLFAKLSNAYVIQANRVGANDEKSFDGASRLYGKNGELLARAEFFKEDLLILDDFKGEIKYMPAGMEQKPEQEFNLSYDRDMERTYLSVCQATKDYFDKNGLKKAVLGLSGGLDSTVCAVILTDVLGKENVYGISMPSRITSDLSKNDAKILAENLGINYREIPISLMVDELKNSFKNINLDTDNTKTKYTIDNFQARTRATILFGVSNEVERCISIATSDKSEAYMGYATINGDMSGGFAPIADITKTKLFALAKWLNKNRKQKNAIPQSIIEKRPGAELAINPKTGKPLLAEEALMPYDFLDEIIWRIEIKHQSKDELKIADYFYEKNNKISKEQKEEWINKFFYRMALASCKGNLMPVFPLIDEVSVNKKVYNAPISAKINFDKIKF